MKEIIVKVIIDTDDSWEEYIDVPDEIILEDSGIYDGLKHGVEIKLIDKK